MNFALLNNQLTEEKDLRLTNKNRGFLYGDGFFETIKIFNKKPFNLENHFDRIIYSADLLDIKFTLSVLDLNKSISILMVSKNPSPYKKPLFLFVNLISFSSVSWLFKSAKFI